MTPSAPLTLDGCAPTPLASYLKALGVLRLISSPANHVDERAADPRARGWWENERFHLQTSLSREALFRFFLEDYAPSPIIAPWNGRAGFLEGDADEASNRTGAKLMNAMEETESSRFRNMQRTIRSLRRSEGLGEYDLLRAKVKTLDKEIKKLSGDERKIIGEEKRRVEKLMKAAKIQLLPTLRSETDAEHLMYMDACYVLSTDEIAAPLLGSGGDDGSRDFGVNFAEHLHALFDFNDGAPKDCGGAELNAALFGVGLKLDGCGTIGQFSPGQGGPNATAGYEGVNPLNSWEVLLILEGAVAFTGAVTKRLGTANGSRAAFPFTFEPSRAGAGNLSSEDPNRPRGEIWTPLWRQPAAFVEVVAMFAEGRLTVGRRMARTGLDAARSIARMGLSRGINAFERYSLIQPDAKMPYQATPLGRFHTPDRPRHDLISDLDAGGWLEIAQQICNTRTAPARARSWMRRLQDALFQMTDFNKAADGARYALVAIGGFVGWLATNPKIRNFLKPPPLLSSAWIRQADDGSAEFRVAAALAGLGLPPPEPRRRAVAESALANAAVIPSVADGGSNAIPATSAAKLPMAAHFAPIDEECFCAGRRIGRRRAWSDSDSPPTAVWGDGDLVSNLIAVLERRLVQTAKLDDKPFGGAVGAGEADVAAFLSGDFDDARCAAFLAGLVWAQPAQLREWRADDEPGSEASLPFAYAVLKPIFTTDETLRRLGALDRGTQLPIPPGLVARLRTGGGGLDGHATDTAVRTALARARASGLPSPFDPARTGARGAGVEGGRMGAGVRADRLAAALLIPVRDRMYANLFERAYFAPGVPPERRNSATEGTYDAA